jgi:hypothetical protein
MLIDTIRKLKKLPLLLTGSPMAIHVITNKYEKHAKM